MKTVSKITIILTSLLITDLQAMHDHTGIRFTVPRTPDEEAAQNLAIADMEAERARAVEMQRSLSDEKSAAAVKFQWPEAQTQVEEQEAPVVGRNPTTSKLRRTGKLKDKGDPAFACTGFPTELQTLVKEYADNVLDFFPVIGTRVQLSFEAHRQDESQNESTKVVKTRFGSMARHLKKDYFFLWDGNKKITVLKKDRSLALKKVYTIEVETFSVAVTNDGLFVTGDGDKFQLWNPLTGKVVKTLKMGREGLFKDFKILSNGDLAAFNYGYVFIWDLATGNCKNILQTGFANMIHECFLAEDETAIFFADHLWGYKYEMTKADLEILLELSEAERENLKQLIRMLNGLSIKEVPTAINQPPAKPLVLSHAARELYNSLPPHIQMRIKQQYELAEGVVGEEVDTTVPVVETPDDGECCAPCVIL